MKISNFKYMETTGTSSLDKRYWAVVDVTTGFGPWKKRVQKDVMREYCGSWFFVENGEYTPAGVVEAMARSYSAKTGIEL